MGPCWVWTQLAAASRATVEILERRRRRRRLIPKTVLDSNMLRYYLGATRTDYLELHPSMRQRNSHGAIFQSGRQH